MPRPNAQHILINILQQTDYKYSAMDNYGELTNQGKDKEDIRLSE